MEERPIDAILRGGVRLVLGAYKKRRRWRPAWRWYLVDLDDTPANQGAHVRFIAVNAQARRPRSAFLDAGHATMSAATALAVLSPLLACREHSSGRVEML